METRLSYVLLWIEQYRPRWHSKAACKGKSDVFFPSREGRERRSCHLLDVRGARRVRRVGADRRVEGDGHLGRRYGSGPENPVPP